MRENTSVKKYLFLCFFLWVSLVEAKVLDAEYKVKFGLLGELGVSHAHLETHGDQYMISIDAKATGIAKTISRDRKEKHVSKGFIKDGRYYTQTYTVSVEYGGKKREKYYVVDYKKKKVTKHKKRYKNGKLLSETTKTLDFFSTDDLLTLYFNFPKLLAKNSKPGTYTFKAVGAERQVGTVELYLPQGKERKKYVKHLGKGADYYLTAIIHQKIFNSNRGELMIAIGKDGVAKKAVLKDLIMFGDLTAVRVK